MGAIGYYNGKLGDLDTMSVPMLDRAFYFGDGCYEACLVRNGVAFGCDAHIDRFFSSLSLLEIPAPCDADALKAVLAECIAAANEPAAVLYWQCSRGTDRRKHNFPAASVRPNLCVMVTPKKLPGAHDAVRLMTADDIRFSMCNVKTLNLLPNVLTNQRATAQGLDGAIFVRDGFVTEGTHSNVHILKDGALVTHPADQYILKGVTRGKLIAICRRFGVKVSERPFTRAELFTADEVLISSSAAHIRRVTEIDGRPVGGREGKLLETLQTAYEEQFLKETTA